MPHLHAGGAERVLVNVVNDLVRRGARVTVAIIRPGGLLRGELDVGVDVVDLRTERASASVRPLSTLLRSGEFETVFTMKSHLIPLVLCARALSRRPVRVVFREVVLKSAAQEHSGWSLINSRPLLSWAYRRLPAIIVPAEEIRSDLVERYHVRPEKIHVIPNPVDIDRIDTLVNEAPNHPWFEESDFPLVAAVGRLEVQKGFDVLIQALAQLDPQLRVRLAIIGEGSERESLQRQIIDTGLQGRVQLLGLRANPYAYLARASVFVLSSRYEGFPNVLLEALACRVPAIATDCPSGPSAIIEDGVSGLLVPVGDVSALTAAMERLVRDRTFADGLADRGRERAESFGVRLVARRFEELLLSEHVEA